jgi:hypothetical protein
MAQSYPVGLLLSLANAEGPSTKFVKLDTRAVDVDFFFLEPHIYSARSLAQRNSSYAT